MLLYVIYITVTYYIAEARDCFIVIGVTNQAQTYDGLTWHAGNLRLFPLATRQAFNDRIHFLDKILFTVVSHFGVCLVTRPLFPKHLGMGNMGGLTTGGCWKPLWVLDPYSFFFLFFVKKRSLKNKELGEIKMRWTHWRPSCRCMTSGSCMARHSSGLHHATPSPHSPHQTGSSCQAALCTSFHRADKEKWADLKLHSNLVDFALILTVIN